jgi:glycosyltransferase involved in cell wall biosynthesis
VKVAYLTNQYPKTSHSFVRREIVGVEAEGICVERVSVRRTTEELVDPRDREEAARTHVLLGGGVAGLLIPAFGALLRAPGRFLSALAAAVRLGRRSDRGVLVNLVYLLEACELCAFARLNGVDHVHAHFGTNPPLVTLLAQLLGGPTYSFTVHGPEEFDRPRFLRIGEKIASAKFVVAISEFGRSQLFRWCELAHWPRIQVVHCGVDELFLGLEPTPVPDVPRLVCVGRLCEQKGQLLLVEAAARVAEDDVPFELVLAGDGEMRAEVEARIAELGISGRVRITGWLAGEEVRSEVLAARAFVLPSFAEGLPVVIMEALALHRPVISTYVAGIPELVTPGECGWLVPAGDVDALAAAMKDALAAPVDELARMGATGAARVAERHDARIEAKKLAALFRGGA